MIYAERYGTGDEPYIAERGVFFTLSEYLPYRVKGWESTKEVDAEADSRLAELASKSDAVIKYLSPMQKFGEDYRFEQIRRLSKD